jgi:enamine deaminase RidA (YjgF/YER057c/UK114 family)
MTIAARLADLGIELPPVFPAAGKYEPLVVVGDLAFVSGHGPAAGDRTVQGKVGADLSLEEGKQAARMTGLSILATLQAELGDLDRVARIVKVLGMVNAAPGFNRTPAVIDGCSELFVEVFGEAGRHARSAVGMAELPFDIAVEIEVVVQLHPSPATTPAG